MASKFMYWMALCWTLVLCPLVGKAQTFSGVNAAGSSSTFSFTPGAGSTNLALTLPGSASGYSHLLLRKGAAPTDSTYDFISQLNGQTNSINLVVPEYSAGTYYAMVRTPAGAPSHSFTLTVESNRTDLLTVQPVSKPLAFTNAATLSAGSWHYYRVEVPTNNPAVRFAIEGTNASPDLYIQRGSIPTTTSFLKRSSNFVNDVVLLADTEAVGGAYFIGVFAPAGVVSPAYTLKTELLTLTSLSFDPGTTHNGTLVHNGQSTVTADSYFKIRTGSPAVGAWRTALNVISGDAHVYLARGTLPSTNFFDYKSDRVGSDGMVLGSTQFSAGEDWYILVRSIGASQWSLVSGAAFVVDLGALAADASSSTNVTVGPEGWRFFKTSIPANTLAWRLWLSNTNGQTATNLMYLRNSSVALPSSFEQFAPGQMLVVPPYLAVGQLYFVSVAGAPGESVNLDSRQQAVTDVSFTSSTSVNYVGYGYTTYRVQVPANEIAWQITLTPSAGNPNVYVRRNLIPNENYNDALSEVGGLVSDSISLVPPTLSDGTFYISVIATNTNSFTLHSGPATITDINYTDTVTNTETNRAGWRYFRVGNIEQQLGTLGWDLFLTNAAPGTRIALRKSRAPSITNFRNPSSGVLPSYDFISISDFLQRPAHQADIWYIGVYSPSNALGAFTLLTRELTASVLTETPFVEGGGNETNVCLLAGTGRTNVAAFKWEFFRVDVPSDVLGWDFRIVNATSGLPKLAIRLGGLPTNDVSSGLVTTNIKTTISSPGSATNWSNGQQWAAGTDWTARTFSADGVNENGRILAMGAGRPLVAGQTYYVGVFNASSNTASYEVVNRFIGTGKRIPVKDLNYAGGAETNTICPREAAYYRVSIPASTPSWKVRLTLLTGEAMLVVSTNKIPNVESEKRMQKLGKEHYVLLPDSGKQYLRPGDYYLAVVGEGNNPATNNRIGTATSSYVVESLGALPIMNLGLLVDELWHTNTLDGGEVSAFQFFTSEDTLGYEAWIQPEYGNPTMVIGDTESVPDPGAGSGASADNYGDEGGDSASIASAYKIYSSGAAPIETFAVKARAVAGLHPDARYVVRIKKYSSTPLTFDGGNHAVVNQPVDTWQFFHVVVPPGVSGWDIRVTNVLAGIPDMVVCRGMVPVDTLTSSGFNPGSSTNWPLFMQWGAYEDWTGRSYSPSGEFEDWRIIATGMGRPLEPGLYYVGVRSALPASYSVMSRAIGTNVTIPIQELAFTNGIATGSLPAREAAYYKVNIPTNTASWRVRLSPGATNEELALIVLKDAIPNVLASSTAANAPTNATSAGRKMQKIGDESYLMLPSPGMTNLLPGDYYVAVISEGADAPSAIRVGAGLSTYTLSSLGEMPVINLGNLVGGVDLVHTGQVFGGESIAYQFTVPPDTSSMEARLQNRVGNPVLVTRPGPFYPYPGLSVTGSSADAYGNDGGQTAGTVGSPTFLNIANPAAGLHYVFVKARITNSVYTNASFTLRLTANNYNTVDFDNGTFSITNQPAGTWRYFKVEVPTNALGWDLRLVDVTAGLPNMVVRRDVLPNSLTAPSWSNPGNAFSWPSSNQWAAASDWTGRSYNANGSVNEDGRVLAMGMGRPLQAGTYYVGVINKTGTNQMSYTLLSRGIGNDLAIPVVEIPYAGGSATNLLLPAREAAYFRVVVPSNSPSWKVRVDGTAGEFMMIGMKDYLPNVNYFAENRSISQGKLFQKPGDEHFVMLPTDGLFSIPAGTNFFAVVSEGANATNNNWIGTGTSSFAISSPGTIPVTDIGVVSSTDLNFTDSLEGGESKAYKFTIPVGIVGVEVKLEDRVGNPVLTLRTGDGLPNPGGSSGSVQAEAYGNEGGYSLTAAHPVLLTLANPVPGTYSLMIKARASQSGYSDASYRIRIREVLTPQLNFASYQNTNGLSNSVSGVLEDNQRAFFMVNVPPITDGNPLGWKLELRQSSGVASVRVRKDSLPSDNPAAGTPFVTSAAYIVPPFFTNGVWFVEVKGSNSTAFTLTSSPIEPERIAWNMPEAGQTNVAPGLAAPIFADTGIDTNGLSIGGDESLYLDQGYQHYYTINVPTNNGGLMRLQLEAISGNPDLYARTAFVPTVSHSLSGGSGSVTERTMVAATGTEYANWVPITGRSETALKPGLWYVMVRANGNANARYRLRASTGNIQNMNITGDNLSGQTLASGDWRYYRFQVPNPVPLNWRVTFTQDSGDVWMYIRDTVPPGQGTGATDYKDWDSTGDRKNNGPYANYNNPGTYWIDTPPTRPGHTYYLGFRAIGDSTFSVSIGTNGAPVAELPDIPFYGGTISIGIPALSQVTYRIDVPPDATRWKHSSTHNTNLLLFLEQGTLPMKTTSDDWRSSSANSSANEYLLDPLPNAWPWVPSQAYFLTITNRSGAAETLTFTMDGRNAVTDDNDNDGMPDAWERLYFGSTSASANTDSDGDGVSNILEYQEGTNPASNSSFNPRLTTTSVNGSITRNPNLSSYPMSSHVLLTPVPNAGYAFVTWSNAVNVSSNPLALLMDGHKNISAIFKVIGDDLSIAVPASGASVTTSGTNIGATKEPGEPSHGGNPGGKSIWWQWTAPAAGNATIDTAGSSFNTLLGVYTGPTVSNLTTIASATTVGVTKAKVTFTAVGGTTYYIAVDGISAASGTVNLSIQGTPVVTTQLRLLSPSWSGGVFQFVLQGDANQVYSVLVSSNLTQWNPLTTVTNSAGGTVIVSDPAANGSTRYYQFRTP